MEKIMIKNGKIVNLKAVIDYIRTNADEDYLNNLLEAMQEFDMQIGDNASFKILESEIFQRINTLSNNLDLSANYILRKLSNKEDLSPEEYMALTTKMEDLMLLMESGNIDFTSQQLLDVFILEVEELANTDREINPRWVNLQNRYNSYLKEQVLAKIEANKKEETAVSSYDHGVMKLKIDNNSNKGIVLIIFILEMVLSLGVVLSFLVLALV